MSIEAGGTMDAAPQNICFIWCSTPEAMYGCLVLSYQHPNVRLKAH